MRLRPKPRRFRPDAGVVTIYDLVLYLAIAALLLVGGILTYNALVSSDKDQVAIADLDALRANIPTFYSGAAGYGTGGLTGNLLAVNAIPQDMLVGSGADAAVQDAWGGKVTVTGVKTATTAAYQIRFDGVPPGGCVKLATLDDDQVGTGPNAFGVMVNGTWLQPPSVATAIAHCNRSGSGPGQGNSVMWEFN